MILPAHLGKGQGLHLHFPFASICLVSALITIKDKCHHENEAKQGGGRGVGEIPRDLVLEQAVESHGREQADKLVWKKSWPE